MSSQGNGSLLTLATPWLHLGYTLGTPWVEYGISATKVYKIHEIGKERVIILLTSTSLFPELPTGTRQLGDASPKSGKDKTVGRQVSPRSSASVATNFSKRCHELQQTLPRSSACVATNFSKRCHKLQQALPQTSASVATNFSKHNRFMECHPPESEGMGIESRFFGLSLSARHGYGCGCSPCGRSLADCRCDRTA